MKKYFYTDGTTSLGPFTLEELRNEGIKVDTLVWFQGMKEWQRADSVDELKVLFETPPAITVEKEEPQQSQQAPQATQAPVYTQQQQRYAIPPKTWLVESILVTIFCCMPFGVIGIINASKVESLFAAGEIDAANKASAEAKKWVSLGFWIMLGFWVLYFGSALIFGVLDIATYLWDF